MQRGPRQTHAGWRETQGLQAGNKGTGCSSRAAGPLCPPAPHHALPIYKSPPMAVLRPHSGERGEGEGAGEWENATGPYPQHHPSTAGSDPGRRKLRGRARGTGKAFHHCPAPTSPTLDRGCATPLQVAAQQTPTTGRREEEGLCAVPDPNTWHLVTPAAANTSPLIPPRSAGRGWACWDRDEKLSGQEAEKKSRGGIMKLRPRKPTLPWGPSGRQAWGAGRRRG